MSQPGTEPADSIGDPFPLPAGAKHPPPSGVTGADGKPYVGAWPEGCNVGLRLAPHIVGIDVDGPEHAPGKTGPQTIARLEEELGPLPFTAYSTRHGAGSQTRVMLFEVPAGAKFRETWLDKPGDDETARDVEIIQAHHRYIVVAPSRLNDGTQYAWYDAEDQPIEQPTIWHIERLPEAWLYRLYAPQSGPAVPFAGDSEAWLKSLDAGEPDERVLAVIERMREDSPREDMLHRQRELIGLGAEGHPGVIAALDVLHGLWMSRSHVSGDPEEEWRRALSDGIKKFGGRIESEPTQDTVKRLMTEVSDPDLARMFFDSGDASDRRKFEQGLLSLGYTEQEVFETVYHLPIRGTVSASALNQEIHDLARPAGDDKLPGALALLSDREREGLQDVYCFVDHYLYAASIIQTPWNPIYHRLNAWSILGVMFSDIGYLRLYKGLNLNLYAMPIGPSGSGKTDAYEDMKHFLKKARRWDTSIGADVSEVGLYETLNERDGEVVFSHSDEADKVLRRMRPDAKGGMAFGSLEAAYAALYDTGAVDQVIRAGRKAEKPDSSGGTHVYFNVWLGGTETRIAQNLTPDQVLSGFIARFISGFGEKPKRDRSSMRAPDQRFQAEDRNPYLTELAADLEEVRQRWLSQGFRHGLRATDAAKDRMADAHELMIASYEDEPLWDLIEPCLTRLMFVMWKAAGLNAMSQGRSFVEVEDVLIAIRETEGWLESTLRLMASISASDFTARVEQVYDAINASGSISQGALYRRMYRKAGMSVREVDEILNNLRLQKRIAEKSGVWTMGESA